jgi:deazaflavin-dependent oxidoreductase (nitroreductase family)
MSDDSSAAIRATRGDWVSEHREMYLASGGAEGHIMDLTPVGGLTFGAHCLIKYRGRKSGKVFIAPLCYGVIGGEVVICASKGGADTHPAWYLNLIADPAVDFQIATQAWHASWREPEGAERARIWDFMVDCFPFYANYQKSTSRVIPLVMMKGIAEIPVFKLEEADGWRD